MAAWVPREHEAFSVEPVAEVLQDGAFGRPGRREALSRVPWSPAVPCARHHHPLTDP
ncbi:hypothetical protein [Streptomyces dangxiongensis]|uniref:hypothetical protein n=1 Tax=Streptomyces dangxiongensis TaxID=1442032 RepID=UPI001F0925CC|nr:hypothetical protein [Streptomyces dangxiongensis]